jgi:hypothetical protein
MYSFRKRSINLNLLDNIHIDGKEILLKWFRGLSIAIFILSVFLYFLKLIFINITNDTFSVNNESFDIPSTDNKNKNYSFYSSLINNTTNDSMFILDMKYFGKYINSFNLTEYKNNQRRNKEIEYLYELYRFNETGIESPILIDYTSSLPHYPLLSNEYQKCFIRGEIISLLNNVVNLTCIDISGINFTNYDFFLRLSFLDKNSSDIKLYILKEIDIKKEITKNEGKRNIIFYKNENMNKNLRYCSNEISSLYNYYKDMPKNYLFVMEINWKNKDQYFCLRNISLIYY